MLDVGKSMLKPIWWEYKPKCQLEFLGITLLSTCIALNTLCKRSTIMPILQIGKQEHRGEVACLRALSKTVAELRIEPRCLNLPSGALSPVCCLITNETLQLFFVTAQVHNMVIREL